MIRRRHAVLTLLLLLAAVLPGRTQPSLTVPKERVGTPLLLGSRIVSISRAHGKVFAEGQRNPRPVLMAFRRDNDTCLRLESVDYGQRRHRLHPAKELHFPILAETDSTYTVDLSKGFSTYPELVSAIPPRWLPGRAESYEILEAEAKERYISVTGRYHYADSMDVTALCYFLYLNEKPMRGRFVDPTKAGYNHDDRDRRGFAQRWDLSGGRTIDFYVDKAFPKEWYPYIQEGIEDWNKTFEAIGLGPVLRVFPEPEEGLPDRYSPLVNMVRFMNVKEANAKGDVLCDPRSGEILSGDILWWRDVPSLLCAWRYLQTGAADSLARRMSYPIEMLGPMIRHAICHEMGHVLGLSHNMGASYAYRADSLRSPSFTRVYGTSASVMDYARYNHLATAEDVAAGVNLLPPRIGPYDYYAIALGYGRPDTKPGPYCYFAPSIHAAISPDPSSQAETLGDDLLRSSEVGVRNCIALLSLDGRNSWRTRLIRQQYYRYICLSLSNLGGCVAGVPVDWRTQNKTLRFIREALRNVPEEIYNPEREEWILKELQGNFLPKRVRERGGEKVFERYEREVQELLEYFY